LDDSELQVCRAATKKTDAQTQFANDMRMLVRSAVGRRMTAEYELEQLIRLFKYAGIEEDVVLIIIQCVCIPVPALEGLQEDAAPFGLEVNWQTTIVQVLGSTSPCSI